MTTVQYAQIFRTLNVACFLIHDMHRREIVCNADPTNDVLSHVQSESPE